MNKYKVGDKIVLTVSDVNEKAYYSYYVFNNNDLILWEPSTDKYAEPLSTYTEPLEAKIRRQAAEITRLLAENKRLKKENKTMSVKIDCYELYGDQHEEEYNQAFNQGAEAAWELARKIVSDIYHGGYNSDELKEIFGYFLYQNIWEDNTYPEAAEKIAEWEKAKEEIKVGDVYKSLSGNFVVCGIDREKDMVKALWDDLSVGKIYLYEIKEQYTKTGRHIDIDSFLKQIGGEE